MKHTANFVKAGLSLGSFFLPGYLNPENPLISELIKGLSSGLLSNIMSQYDPAELLGSLDKNNTHLNHDIGQLMAASVPRAVELVAGKFLQEQPHDPEIKALLRQLVADAKLPEWSFSDDASFLAGKNDWIGVIHNYLFLSHTIPAAKLEGVDRFFQDNLPDCFELVFTEGLKDEKDEKPLKAFIIKILTGLNDQFSDHKALSNEILAEIRLVKDNGSSTALAIGKGYFAKEFAGVNAKLAQILRGQETLIEGQGDLKKGQGRILDAVLRQGRKEIGRHLAVPPFTPEKFFGRKQELEVIRVKLHTTTHALVLVNGDGGVGKTSIASTYYHAQASHYQHLAWVTSEKNIGNALLSLAPGLGVEFDDQEQMEGRLGKILIALANLAKPSLLVIDNANEPEDLEKHYTALKRLPGLHLLLTSRLRDFENAETLYIEGLPDEEAKALFLRYYKKHNPEEDPLLLAIYEAVGRNTLVLELMAKNLHLLNRPIPKYSLQNLLADLQHEGLLGLTQSKEVTLAYQTFRKAKPEAIIAAMYKMADLSEEEVRLLSQLVLLPSENIPVAMLSRLFEGQENWEDVLTERLAKKGWINFNAEEENFKTSPVIQEVVRKKNPALRPHAQPLLDRLAYLLARDDSGHTTNMPYADCLLAARYAEGIVLTLDPNEPSAFVFLQNLGNYFAEYANLEKAAHYYSLLEKAAKSALHKNTNDRYAKKCLAVSYSKLGDLHKTLGKPELALDFFEKGTVLFEELFEEFPKQVGFKNGLAFSYSKLGDLHQALGNLELALDFFEKETVLFEELFEEFPKQVGFKNGLAVSYFKLGLYYEKVSNAQLAKPYFLKCKCLLVELVQEYPNHPEFVRNLAWVENKLTSY